MLVLLVLLVLLILLLVLVLSLLVLVLLVLVLVVLLVLLVLLALLQQSLCIRQVIAGVVVLGVQFQRLAVVVDGLLEVLSAVFTVGETRLEVAVATVVEYALPLCGVEVFALQRLSVVLGGLCVVLLAVEGVAQVVVAGPVGTVSIQRFAVVQFCFVVLLFFVLSVALTHGFARGAVLCLSGHGQQHQ